MDLDSTTRSTSSMQLGGHEAIPVADEPASIPVESVGVWRAGPPLKTTQVVAAMVLLTLPVLGAVAIIVDAITNATSGRYYYWVNDYNPTSSEIMAFPWSGPLITSNTTVEPFRMSLNDRDTEGAFRWASRPSAPHTHARGERASSDAIPLIADGVRLGASEWSDSDQWDDWAVWASSLVLGSTTIRLDGMVQVDPLVMGVQLASVEVSWNSEAARQYQVQYSSTSTTGAWVNLGA